MDLLNSQDFMIASQIYEKNNNQFEASFTSDISLNDTDNSDDTSEKTNDEKDQSKDSNKLRFQAPSQKDVNHTINDSRVANTNHNTQTWVNTINEYFMNLKLPGDITQVEKLENILIGFFVALKRKDGQPYASTSIHNCFCGIARHLLYNSCQDPKPNIFDKNYFPRLYATIDGKIKLVQDTNHRQTAKSDSLTNDEII
ncbi:38690_t:CDS:2 [Gigaspora margarita]|uniref:38690_t:CDS:1 n=1 Tax=Gigaspora margarita TaxID=4874 RepID=A0ABN7WA72_GIGMA|nr:38690_t:CDS:2 [Gigaspora margarita]